MYFGGEKLKRPDIVQAFFFLFLLLALTACTQTVYTSKNQGSPVILFLYRGGDVSQPSLGVSCLQSKDCNYQIDSLTIDEIDPFNCILDKDSNIYCPLRDSENNDQIAQKRDLIFIDFKTKHLKQISLSDPSSGLENVTFLHPVQSLDQQITFMDSEGQLFVLKNGALIRVLQLPLSENVTFLNEFRTDDKTEFNLLIPGNTFSWYGESYGKVYLVNTLTGKLEPRILRLPDFLAPPFPFYASQKRYGMNILSVSENWQKVYISYDEILSESPDSLTSITSIYDWQTGVEEKVNDIGSFENYRGIFFRPILFRTEIASISPTPIFGLFSENWNQVQEFQTIGAKALAKGTTKIQIRPFGDTFLIGTDDSVYQISTETGFVKEFQLPETLGKSDYFIIQYQN